MSRRRAGILALLAALAALPSSAAAAGSRIAVDPGDTPLVIRGFVGDSSGFTGAIRLHATGAAIASYQALPSDLRAADGRTIGRSHVTLASTPALAPGALVDVTVAVDGVAEPDVYRGRLELVPAGAPRSAETVVPLELDALAHPTLTALAPDDSVHGALARCGLSCGLTGLLVPGSAGGQSQTIALAVGDSPDASVTSVQVLGAGDRNGHQLTNADLGLPATLARPRDSVGGVVRLHLHVNPGTLPADHYTGTVRLAVANLDAPVTVPIDFSVRDAPYLALLALLLGIALGRLSQYLSAGTGAQRRDLYERAGLLRRRARRARDAAMLTQVADAQAAIDDDDLDQASRLLDAAEADGAGAAARPPAPATALQNATAAVGHAAAVVSPVKTELGVGAHLIGLATWIGLLLVGYQTLYVQQGTAFGSNGIFDYVALILWGLSADVASRTLGNLTGRAPATA